MVIWTRLCLIPNSGKFAPHQYSLTHSGPVSPHPHLSALIPSLSPGSWLTASGRQEIGTGAGHLGTNTQRGVEGCLSPPEMMDSQLQQKRFPFMEWHIHTGGKGTWAKEKACLCCLWLNNCGHLASVVPSGKGGQLDQESLKAITPEGGAQVGKAVASGESSTGRQAAWVQSQNHQAPSGQRTFTLDCASSSFMLACPTPLSLLSVLKDPWTMYYNFRSV